MADQMERDLVVARMLGNFTTHAPTIMRAARADLQRIISAITGDDIERARVIYANRLSYALDARGSANQCYRSFRLVERDHTPMPALRRELYGILREVRVLSRQLETIPDPLVARYDELLVTR